MSKDAVLFTLPIGRLVSGSVHTGSDRDNFNGGAQFIFQSGVNAGKPKFKHWFSVAIKKGSEKHWKETEWGKIIYATAKERFPKQIDSPLFSWKVVDGDSTIPNSNGTAPVEKEGFKGCWVVNLTNWSLSAETTNVYMRDGKDKIKEGLRVEPGDYIQVHASVDHNDSTQKPGVFLSQKAVSFCGLGDRIVFSTFDASQVFGKSDLPEGAREIPEVATGYDEMLDM